MFFEFPWIARWDMSARANEPGADHIRCWPFSWAPEWILKESSLVYNIIKKNLNKEQTSSAKGQISTHCAVSTINSVDFDFRYVNILPWTFCYCKIVTRSSQGDKEPRSHWKALDLSAHKFDNRGFTCLQSCKYESFRCLLPRLDFRDNFSAKRKSAHSRAAKPRILTNLWSTN